MKDTGIFISIILISVVTISCKDSPTTKDTISHNDTVQFFPIAGYLQQQINSVNNSNSTVYKITVKGNKKDSSTIDNKTFNDLSKKFILYDISDSANKKFYKETVFQDESTNSYTINYNSNNKKLPVQSIDILLDMQTQEVKRIFMNILHQSADSTVVEKLGWKANSSFFINKIISYADGKETEEQNTIVWNNKE